MSNFAKNVGKLLDNMNDEPQCYTENMSDTLLTLYHIEKADRQISYETTLFVLQIVPKNFLQALE